RSVIKHLLAAFAAMGVPTEIKTDNGLGYRTQSLKTFLQLWGITHKFGVRHKSTGQAIVECAHRT
ncbi:POK11 protein, partial [Spizaetus tyrannus]|nr:POK11 protein [Spizaetus tyrannus]